MEAKSGVNFSSVICCIRRATHHDVKYWTFQHILYQIIPRTVSIGSYSIVDPFHNNNYVCFTKNVKCIRANVPKPCCCCLCFSFVLFRLREPTSAARCTRKLTLYLFSLFDETKTVETWTKCILSIFCSCSVPKCVCIVYRGQKVVDIAERAARPSPNPREHFFSCSKNQYFHIFSPYQLIRMRPTRMDRSALLMNDVIFHRCLSFHDITVINSFIQRKTYFSKLSLSRARKKSKERRKTTLDSSDQKIMRNKFITKQFRRH